MILFSNGQKLRGKEIRRKMHAMVVFSPPSFQKKVKGSISMSWLQQGCRCTVGFSCCLLRSAYTLPFAFRMSRPAERVLPAVTQKDGSKTTAQAAHHFCPSSWRQEPLLQRRNNQNFLKGQLEGNVSFSCPSRQAEFLTSENFEEKRRHTHTHAKTLTEHRCFIQKKERHEPYIKEPQN